MCDILNKNYKGFDFISCWDIPELNSKALYFCHKKTGLKVFHLCNNDKENLFSFSFNTIPQNSKGLPHIMEHSVLCGSAKYPCRDPFLQLLKQSVNTFLNAMTASDITMYPASSTIEADYFNLMSVYADAVFFPLLKKEMFLQEACHLEVDKEDKPCLRGVVFNEMQGAYADFDSVASDNVVRCVLSSTPYALDSGGDPVDIPSLTYQEYLDFHKTYYSPGNCFVFLYGNIDTKKQLDFIEDNVLCHIKDAPPTPPLPYQRLDTLATKSFESDSIIHTFGPCVNSEDKDARSNVYFAFRMGELNDCQTMMEMNFLEELLLGHDGTQINSALLESGILESLVSSNGLWTGSRQGIFSFGGAKVKIGQEQKLKTIVLSALKDICSKDILDTEIQAALMSLEFSIQEQKRLQGPYSLTLMQKVLHAWQYNMDFSLVLQPSCVLNTIKQNIQKDKNYIKGLIKKYFLDNTNSTLVIVTPSKTFLSDRAKKIQNYAAQMLKQKGLEFSKQQLKHLNDTQLKDDTKEASLIPHLTIADLDTNIQKTPITCQLENFAGKNINVFYSDADTKDIIYIDLLFPFDTIQPKYYMYVPLLCRVLTNCGYKGKDWQKEAKDFSCHIGEITTGQNINTIPKGCLPDKKLPEYSGRYYLQIKIKVLKDHLKDALDLVAQCLTKVDFLDASRIKDLLQKNNNQNLLSLIPYGHNYVATRAQAVFDKHSCTKELLFGISGISFAFDVLKMDIKEVANTFCNLWQKIKSSGTLIHITAKKQNLQFTKKLLPAFVLNAGLLPLAPPLKTTLQDLLPYIKGYRPYTKDTIDILEVSSLVGFAGLCIPPTDTNTNALFYTSPLLQHLVVLSRLLSSGALWQIIRTKGGAYGAYAKEDITKNLFCFFTYRDPAPQNSLDVFQKVLQDVIKTPPSLDDIQKTIIGCYSVLFAPESPQDAAYTQLKRALSLITDDKRQQNMDTLLKTTPKDVKDAASYLLGKINSCHKALICSRDIIKNIKNTSAADINVYKI